MTEQSEHTIKNLEEVLSAVIKNNKKICKTEISSLTNPGENYGSIMSKLDITLRNEKDGSSEEIHAVAKEIPKQEFVQKIFNTQVTFKNEIAMYDTIMPTLKNFQRENGVNEVIDCAAEFYGGRINLGEANGTVDENAVLILENLISKGYRVVDRHVGFNLKTAKFILKDLAAFHAIPIALKLKKSEVFEEKIRPYLAPFRPPSMPNDKEFQNVILEVLEESDQCRPWIDKLRDIYKHQKETRNAPPREPFATMTHGDIWVNNTMVKFQNGEPVHNKLVDFQICDYKSPATDVIFFLCTSVQLPVLREHLDNLIEYYHKHFISHLEQLKCDTAPFSFAKFLDEIKATTASEIPHTIMMLLMVVFGKKGGPSNDFGEGSEPDHKEMKEKLNQFAKEKAWFIIKACGERGWL